MKFTTDSTLDTLANVQGFPSLARKDEADSIRSLRERGWTAFQAGGFDVRGREEWKYTDLKALEAAGYRVGAVAVTSDEVPQIDSMHEEAWRLVFVNGVLRPELGSVGDLPQNLVLRSLTEERGDDSLGRVAEHVGAPLTALNTAVWTDGLQLVVPNGVRIERPIELYFVTDSTANDRLVAPRNLIRLEEGASATVIESYFGRDGVSALVLPVTEIECATDSELRHWKLMREATGSRHYGSTHVRQEAGSRYESREFSFGGTAVRREVHVALAGTGAHCDINSLVMAAGEERMDNRTRVNHLVPGCTTDELYKGIYADRSRGVFDGLIEVHRDAQQTVAHQTNRNLLLSDDASISSIPRLEIYADDVKCSHGSTTGQLDDEQVFFLRSRGFAADAARVILAQAFGSEVVDGVASPQLRQMLNGEISARLAGVNTLGVER